MNILKPGAIILTVFGILYCMAVIYVYCMLSLTSGIFVVFFVAVVLFCFCLLLIVSFWYDEKYNTNTLRYFTLSILLLPVCYYIGPQINDQLEANTHKNAESLYLSVKNYKLKYGKYPDNINHPYFNAITKKPFFSSRVHYYKYADANGVISTFEIRYSASGGTMAFRSEYSDEWIYVD